MSLRMGEHDLAVYKPDDGRPTQPLRDDIDMRFFDGWVEDIRRFEDRIELVFSNGGMIEILTEHPLCWVEPERH